MLKSQLKTTKMLGTNYKYLQCEELTEPRLSPQLSQTGKLRELRDNVHSRLCRFEGGGGGCLSSGRFPWEKWDFCSEIKN